jgi:hypothetical protein
VAQNQNWGAGGGGFLRVLGIIYLVKTIRRRREQRRLATVGASNAGPPSGTKPPSSPPR